jgi:hypothetical protein
MSLKSVAHSGRADSLNYGSATTPPIALAAAVAADVLASPFTTVRQSSSALVQELPTARSIAERADWLYRIALAREGMGRREDAVATYREALEATDAIPSASTRTNVLFGVIAGMLVGPQPARLIAESAPQVARIAESIERELRRSSALVVIASALPN